MSDLLPHQQRVVDELADLEQNLAALDAFLRKPAPADMTSHDRSLLEQQQTVMLQYACILRKRVERFPGQAHYADMLAAFREGVLQTKFIGDGEEWQDWSDSYPPTFIMPAEHYRRRA